MTDAELDGECSTQNRLSQPEIPFVNPRLFSDELRYLYYL